MRLMDRLLALHCDAEPPGRGMSARTPFVSRAHLARSANGVRNGFRRPAGRGSGQFVESALDTLYVARNRGRIDIVAF